MKHKILVHGLNFISNKKRQYLFLKALNFLSEPDCLADCFGKVIEVRLLNTRFFWRFVYDGTQFILSNEKPQVTIFANIDDLLNFPSATTLKKKIALGEINISASDANQKVVIELLESINPTKVNRCVCYLRKMFGLKNSQIQEKSLTNLTIRDITSDVDINYVRDQALLVERFDPSLAFKLMHLAYGARPNGPFLKRKVDEYRSKGFDCPMDSNLQSLRVIPIINGRLGYFPLPKVGCSSIKAALYELCNQQEFDSINYDGKHLHHYWSSKMAPLEDFERTILVIRDPIERFLSAYGSRVLDHKELSQAAIKSHSGWLANIIPAYNPTISQFISNLDVYLQVPSIGHHCKPLSVWVNNSLDSFSDIFPINDMNKVQNLIEEYSLSKIQVPRRHVGKNKVGIEQLSRDELDTLLHFYRRDYELLAPWYSQEAIIQKWQQRQVTKV